MYWLAARPYLAPLRESEGVVHGKRPFGGPQDVLRYEFIRRFLIHSLPPALTAMD
jgi:hypothetical protein